jgi:tetratricopeptide (TPR) repeat protein
MENIKSYQVIQSLVLSLTDDEKRIAQQYLLAFDKKKREYIPKIILLFNHIIINHHDKKPPFEHLYPNKNKAAFQLLCYHLRNKVLESLILEVNTNRPGYTSSLGKAFIECNKMLMQARLCFSKGQSKLAISLLNTLISKGKKHEIYPIIIEGLYIKKRVLNLRYGSKNSIKLQQQIVRYENCRDAGHQSIELQNQLQSLIGFSNTISKKQLAFEKKIENTEQKYKENLSPKLEYNFLNLKMNYYQSIMHFETSNNYCLQMQKFINTHKHLYTKIIEGSILLNQAHNYTFMGNFKKSLINVKKAIDFFPKGSFNYYTLQKTTFYALYYQAQYTEAYTLAQNNKTLPQAQKTSFQQAQWNYWLAVCLFNKQEYKQAQKLLNEIQELKKDTEGWNFSIQILNFACSVELKDWDTGDIQIDALRNFYYRKQGLGARTNTIIKILLGLEYSYNFKEVFAKHKKELEKLKTAKGWYKWKIQTPNLFLFQQWFYSHIEKQPYQPDFSTIIN